MEIEPEEFTGWQLSQSLDYYAGAVRCLATLDNFLMIGSTDKSCKIYEFNTESKTYLEIAKIEISDEYIYAVHIFKTDDYRFAFAGKDKNIYVCDK